MSLWLMLPLTPTPPSLPLLSWQSVATSVSRSTSGLHQVSGKLIIPYCLASQKLNFSLSSFNWPDNDTHCATRLTRLVIEVISLPQAGSEKEYFTLPGSHGNLSPPPLPRCFAKFLRQFFGSQSLSWVGRSTGWAPSFPLLWIEVGFGSEVLQLAIDTEPTHMTCSYYATTQWT